MNRANERLCTSESERIGREFIDNWSHYISLVEDSNETDLLNLLDVLDRTRINWQKSEAECKLYKSKMVTFEKKAALLQTDNDTLQDRLRNCQAQLTHVANGKKDVEYELAEHKRIIEQLRNIIKSNDLNLISDGLLAVINSTSKRPSPTKSINNNTYDNNTTTTGTVVTTHHFGVRASMESNQSDIDYDRTADSLESSSETTPSRRESRKRRSRSLVPENSRNVRFNSSSIIKDGGYDETPSKRSRNGGEDTEITATIKIDTSGQRKPSGTVRIRRSMNRSMSESTLIEKKEKIQLKTQALTPSIARSTYDIRSPHAIASSWTRGQDIQRRTHRVSKFHPVFEACDVCKKRFGITATNALRCVDCNIRFHRHCHARAPMPCVPKIMLPKTPSKQKTALVYYCPDTHPFIPPLLIHCIVALERDRLTREGIYRLPGSETAVTKLYNEFMTSRVVPNLANVESETITGCIKKFLRELRDQLIPATSFDEFMKAIENNDDEAIIESFLDLPAPNRDTLAYFLLHLRKVAKNSSHNKMPIENLARVLAPTIIGYSKLHAKTLENANELSRNQYSILLRLLRISSEFWNRFITQNMSAVLAAEARTPGSKTALLTLTPTTTAPRRGDRVETIMELETDETHQTSSPLIQPLSMASTTMRGIYFKDAL